MLHCPGDIQLADGLTKILPGTRHQFLREKIGLIPNVGRPLVRAVQGDGHAALGPTAQDIQLWMLLMLIVMQLPEVEAADDEEGAAEPPELGVIGTCIDDDDVCLVCLGVCQVLPSEVL